jgi:hypothetical protein
MNWARLSLLNLILSVTGVRLLRLVVVSFKASNLSHLPGGERGGRTLAYATSPYSNTSRF